MIGADASPARFSGAVALCWAFVSVGTVALHSRPALAIGGIGAALFTWGLLGGSRRRLGGGAFVIFVAALTGGGLGSPVDATLLGVTTAVLAWDAAGTAMGLGTQLGGDARTVRAELVHLSASAVVAAVTIAFGYAAFSIGTGAVSTSGLIYLVLAALALLFAAGVGSRE